MNKFIRNFNGFIKEEWSKNDPIPEITRLDKLGIILLGSPGIGKSTFIKEFIHPKNFNLKVFSTDDVSLVFTKNPKVYHPTASELNINRLLGFLKTGQGFIYDTTGTQIENITNIFKLSKEYGYTIIFIHLMGTFEMAKAGNLSRERNVPEDYLISSYKKQSSLMRYCNSLKPDNYYIVNRDSSGYAFSKV